MLAGLTWVFVLAYRHHRRSPNRRAGQMIGLGLFSCAGLAALTGGVILGLIVGPTYDALGNWALAQEHQLKTRNCPTTAGAAFLAAYERALDGDTITWLHIGAVLVGVGLGALFLSLILVTWVARRTRARLARQ
jgi:hypothetical protein